MKHVNIKDAAKNALALPGAKDASIRLLIGPEDAPNFMMIMIELEPEGNTPDHHHEWEEEIFIASGRGILKTKDGDMPLNTGDALIIDPDMQHQFVNNGGENLAFICVIPKRG
jgi:quercetin dioxygenase-like cupin family protein